MPGMPRPKGKGKKIAYSILGVPANIAFKPSEYQKKINRALIYQETDRSR